MNMLNDHAIQLRLTLSIAALAACPLVDSYLVLRYQEVIDRLHQYRKKRRALFLFACALYEFSNTVSCLDIAENNIRRLRSHLLLTPSADQDCVDTMALGHAAAKCKDAHDEITAAHFAVEYRLGMLETSTC